MPRLLPHGALDAPSFTTRWTAIVAAACALTAWQLDWTGAYDAIRGLAPTASDRYTWDESDLAAAPAAAATGLLDGIDDPAAAQARTLTVPTGDLTIDLVWEAPLTISELRLETYTDAFGTGHRLGIAADTTTAGGPNCLNARLTAGEATTTLQWCSRADQHAPVDMAAFLGKEDDDRWRPDRLFFTQTANLDPADYDTATQVDYYGFGVNAGDSHDSGVWGPHWSRPMMGDNYQHCDDLDMQLRLDDLHLTDRYSDPAASRREQATVYDRTPAFPSEHRLLTPACIPLTERGGMNPQTFHRFAAEPFQRSTTTPLSGWIRYNAATRDTQPLRTAVVIDVRSCDTTAEHCTADRRIDEHSRNDGPANEWMTELLGITCTHAIGGDPCPGLGPDD